MESISENIFSDNIKRPVPELLSPAGNPEKMKYALHYGADAVYLAGKSFGMRTAAGNFSDDELKIAIQTAHKLKKKVYLTVNTMPHMNELKQLEQYLEFVNDVKPDAVIVADLGVLKMCSKILNGIDFHISTQGAITNSESCKVWHDLGGKRVVLARELSLNEISEIRNNVPDDLEIETFVHGAMCVSISGRCLLSEYYTDRDANRGSCTQPCRWIYHFDEVKRPDDIMTGEVHKEGTYIFGSKDMCLINKIRELCSVGISSFKIEGRMKSSYYTAVVTNAYRIALDALYGISNNLYDDELKIRLCRELDSVSHREYCEGYFFSHPMNSPHLASVPGYMRDTSYLAVVDQFDEETSRAQCTQKNKTKCGDKVELISPGETGKVFYIEDIKDEFGEIIMETPHPQMKFSIKVPFKVNQGDIIRAYSEHFDINNFIS